MHKFINDNGNINKIKDYDSDILYFDAIHGSCPHPFHSRIDSTILNNGNKSSNKTSDADGINYELNY